jgi:bisphosphoglycerate-dependent phosphoglycerate mutase
MKKVKGIVLTYDLQGGLAHLVVKAYESLLGKELPIEFLVPYQSIETYADIPLGNVTLVESHSNSIRATMKSLLERVVDDEWVLWCIDDRYPINMDTTAFCGLSQA